MLERYLQREQHRSALLIQKTWRGHNTRRYIQDREVFVKRYRAAIVVQRGVSRFYIIMRLFQKHYCIKGKCLLGGNIRLFYISM